MRQIQNTLLLCGPAALVGLFAAGCGDGAFVGPPGGSSGSTRGGQEPLLGATMFSFYPEIEQKTGFAVDQWFLSPGQDSNDTYTANLPQGDGIDALKDADFEEFVSGNKSKQTPGYLEINTQFPITMSFLAQWFFRNADGSRPKEFDAAGREVFSPSALDISIFSAPLEEQRDNQGNLVSILINRLRYPNRDIGAGSNLPLKQWTSPPPTDPGQGFPSPQEVFVGQQFNELAMLRVRAVSQAAATISGTYGGAISDDDKNSHVENMGSFPIPNPQTGQPTSVTKPTGVFSDNYALDYKLMPVKHPDKPPPPASLSIRNNDKVLEEALIEYSRHLAAVHANLIGQAVGLTQGDPGSLMDPAMVKWQNGYQYRFTSNQIDLLANKVLGNPIPGSTKSWTGLLPGLYR